MTNQEIQNQNRMVSKRNQQRKFLQRKIAQHEHTAPRDMEQRARNRRMAAIYRQELKVLEAA